MKKIIHLSDIHLGYDNLTSTMDRLVAGILEQIDNPDEYIIVLTGDIVQDATKDGSYDLALNHLQPLKEAGFKILCAPGNHDYGTGNVGNPKFVKKFKEYFWGDTNFIYPKKTIIDNIAFLCLYSMAEELHWYDRLSAQGELGCRQLGRLEAKLRDDDVKAADYVVVYLHHNPFYGWDPLHRLKDNTELGDVLQKAGNVSALLFGHKHQGQTYKEWGIPRVYDAGTSTKKGGNPNPYRVMDLSQDPSTDYEADFLHPDGDDA